MIILDSDVITLFMHGNEVVQRHYEAALTANPNERIVTTVVNWSEAIGGRTSAILTAEGERLLQAEEVLWNTHNFLNQFDILSFSTEALTHLEAMRKQKGLKAGHADRLIASIALANKAVIATGNVKHYKDIKGLSIHDWTK